ncbi:MAG: helix-turn-helix domain-containing protein [Clostridia bacterium]|nr:helix-turn-helix domain-containing protein [Clostridia bacterium]
MKLLIGKRLRAYRREKSLTQEDVAQHLGESYQAVSKWERDEGYPEITMLPALANYLGISVDELIGMEEIASKNRYDEINAIWSENHSLGKSTGDEAYHVKNVELMRNGLKLYPNDQLLLVQLSTSLSKLSGSEKEKLERLREIVRIEEQILSGEDSEVRSSTLYNICFDYELLGEHEKALETANKLPNLFKSRENAFAVLGSDEEKKNNSKQALKTLKWILHLHFETLGKCENSPDYLVACEKILNVLEPFTGD